MLTLPDVRAKQLLFVRTEKGAKNRLFFRNENLIFEKDDKIINQASCHRLLAAFVVGDFSFTSGLIKECRKRAVSLFFLNNNLNPYGIYNAKAEGNYLLRAAQYAADEQKELVIAKKIVKNKIQNQSRLMRPGDSLKDDFEKSILAAEMAKSGIELLGIEGNFSRIFFQKYFKETNWYRRMPRVKPDEINLLLDIGYTFLFNFLDSLLLLFGFDTYKGCYHKLFFQRKSLTCDIVEPFRCIIEKQILKSFHLGQIDKNDFFFEQGRCGLDYKQNQKYAKIFLEAIMDNREALYCYVQKFYRYIMNRKNVFPEFNVLSGEVK